MGFFAHLLIFLLSTAVIWILSGILIDATDRVAKRYNKPGFAVAFFVLGLLTSISEISVATNATLENVPQVSAGNLMGASLVIFFLIIPLLAVAGGGIPISPVLSKRTLLYVLCIVLLPALVSADGHLEVIEGFTLLLLYCTLIYAVQKRKPLEEVVEQALEQTEVELLHKHRATAMDALKILGGAILIFLAGNILVGESVSIARALSIPVSIVGLLLLSIGTNIPELVIAIRCIFGRHKDIAFGDYMGSGAANTLVFGVLIVVNGSFSIEPSEGIMTLILMGAGLIAFYLFSRTKNDISRREGLILLGIYALFLILQLGNAVRLSLEAPPTDVLHEAAPNI